MTKVVSREELIAKSAASFAAGVGRLGTEFGGIRNMMLNVASYQYDERSGWESNQDVGNFLRSQGDAIDRANMRSQWYRENSRPRRIPELEDMMSKSGEPIAKAAGNSILDVGTSLNLSSIAGGQAVGYMSLDTRLYRSTIRPNSFTLYNMLQKSQAFQVVDLWSTATDTGGGPAGTNFQTVDQGASIIGTSLQTSAGVYDLNTLLLALVINGRAITIPLAAQNNFVDITAQETANAALSCLYSVDWACYKGDTGLWSSQFNGIGTVLSSSVSGNIFDFWNYYTTNAAASGLSQQQALFNLIYEVVGKLTLQYTWSHITHAVMSPTTAGDIQSLVTTQLQNWINLGRGMQIEGINVNGDLQGMKTRFGEIQFPVDVCIPARDVPVQAYKTSTGSTYCIATPSAPSGVTASLVTGSTYLPNNWTSQFTASSAVVEYAVASTDAYMNESVLTYSNVISGMTTADAAAGAGYQVAIGVPSATTGLAAYRVFRSGLGYALTSNQLPQSFRHIANVSGSTTATVNFVDLNLQLPNGQDTYLLDLDPGDGAIDFRMLLPMTKVNLFADNIYMPWAVCAIGALRVTIPKFHALVKNYPAVDPTWNMLQQNYDPPGSWNA